ISQSEIFDPLRVLAQEWTASMKQYGPGVLNLKLEQLLGTPVQAAAFAKLVQELLTKTAQYEEKLPASLLNQRISVPGVTFYDYDVLLLKDALERLRTLVFGK